MIYILKIEEKRRWNISRKSEGKRYDTKIIYQYHFEDIFWIDSAFGWLKVLYRIEDLTSLTKFTRASSLEKVLGVVDREEINYDKISSSLDIHTLSWIRERKL